MAVRTRSFDSRTAVSGSPTISKAGSPAAESTSTAMMSPSTPIVVPPNDLANNRNPPISTTRLPFCFSAREGR